MKTKNVKKILFCIIIFALGTVNAKEITSRETSNQVVIKSDKTTVNASLIYTGQSAGLSAGLGSKKITNFRGGAPKSRLGACAVTSSTIFTKESDAKAAVSNCFNEGIYNQIEADMAYLMKNNNAQTSLYTFTQPVTMNFKVRDASGVKIVKEDMYVTMTMLMRAGDPLGGSTRMGFLMSQRQTFQYLYVKYEQGKNFDMFADTAGMKMPDAGKALVYTISDPVNINAGRQLYTQLGSLNAYDEPMEPTDPSKEETYDQDEGVVKLLTDLRPVMEETGSATLILDYGRRVEPKYIQDNDGNLRPELFEIRVKDRYYFKDECKLEGVKIGQDSQMNIQADYRRDRYVVTNIAQLTPVKLGNIGVQENIDTSSDSEAQKFKNMVVKTNNKDFHSGYDYTTPFEQYTNKVADPIGTYSTAPKNLFVQWTDDPYNKFPASIYKEIAPMRNETICKVEYMETYEVAAGYWKQEPIYGQINSCTPIPTGGQHCTSHSGIVGYQSVWEPAVYGKKKAQACIQNTLVDAYCSTKECVTTCNNATKGGQYFWSMSAWSGCSNGCGAGLQYRTVACKDKNGTTVGDVYCSGAGGKPATQQACQGVTSCGYSWDIGGWSACSNNCSGGYQTRDIFCRRSDGSAVPDSYCGGKPAAIQQCSNPSAPECQPVGVYVWKNSGTCETTGGSVSRCAEKAGRVNNGQCSASSPNGYRGTEWDSGGSGNGAGSGWRYAQVQTCQLCTGSSCSNDTITKAVYTGTKCYGSDIYCGLNPALFVSECGLNKGKVGQYTRRLVYGSRPGEPNSTEIDACVERWDP